MNEKEITKEVEKCIEKLKEEFKKSPSNFHNEKELHSLFYCLWHQKQKDNVVIWLEHPTKLLYVRNKDGELSEGFEIDSVEHIKQKDNKKRPRPGEIDIVILDKNNENNKIIVAIEFEIINGKSDKKNKSHVKNDCKKLSEIGNGIQNKYILIFTHKNKLTSYIEKFRNEVETKGIKFILIEPDK